MGLIPRNSNPLGIYFLFDILYRIGMINILFLKVYYLEIIMNTITRFIPLGLILSGFFLQNPLVCMDRKVQMRARLQAKARKSRGEATIAELESLQNDANVLFLQNKFIDLIDEYTRANAALWQAAEHQREVFGEGTLFFKEKEDHSEEGNLEEPWMLNVFKIHNPEIIALLLQHPVLMDENYFQKNPQFIERCLKNPHHEIQHIGHIGKSILSSIRCNSIFKEKYRVFEAFERQLRQLIKEKKLSVSEDSHLKKMLSLSQEYQRYLLENPSAEITDIDRRYYHQQEEIIQDYKNKFNIINALYEETIKLINQKAGTRKSKYTLELLTQIPLPDSLLQKDVVRKLTTSKIKEKKSNSKQSRLMGGASKHDSLKTKNIKQHQQPSTTKPVAASAAAVPEPEPIEIAVAPASMPESVGISTVAAKSESVETSSAEAPAGPALAFRDGSHLVANNDYFVTIYHPELGTYLFYKPRENQTVSFEPPNFIYHPRVAIYLDNPDQALADEYTTERYSPTTLKKIKALKAFPHAADLLIKSLGISDEFIDARKRKISRITLMGQIKPHDGSDAIHCVFQWGFMPGTNICYHRCATEKIPEAMIKEYYQRKFDVEFPPLPSR
jgi:hypothetical protein